jgi:chromosome segregation ATPase
VEKFRPARVAARTLAHAISTIEGALERLNAELSEAKSETVKLEGELKVLETKRSPRELRNNAFRRHVEELMQGWLTYIAQAFPRQRDAKEAEAQQVRAEAIALLIQ